MPSSLQPHVLPLQAWDFPGKHTRVGCYFLLQEIFLTQGSNPRLLHWQVNHYHFSPLLLLLLSPKDIKLNFLSTALFCWCFPGGSVVKNPPANAGDVGLIPGSGRSPGGGNGNPLQYSCLENPMERGAWRATVYGVAKSQTQLSN